MEAEWEVFNHEQLPTKDENAVAKDVFSGTIGGIAQVLSGQPFDTTKVRLQSAPDGTYNGAMDVVKRLLKEDGPKGFYRGTLTPLIGVGACVSVQFAVNEGMKRLCTEKNKEQGQARPELLSYPQLYISGMAAGLANAFLAGPIEQVRIRLQTQTGKPGTISFNGPLDVIRKLWSAAGLAGIYRGLTTTLLREGHGMAMYFMAAEACVKKDMSINNISRAQVPTWRVCVYGGIAGITMWLTCYPLDIVKSKMQTDSINPSQYKYKSTLQCFQDILRTNGPRGLFKGFTPTLLRAFPVNACTFMAFEATRRLID